MRNNLRVRLDRVSPLTGAAVLLCGLLAASLCGPRDSSLALAAEPQKPEKEAAEPAAPPPNAIVAGVGWKKLQLGMKRQELLKVLGKPDANSTEDWLKWAGKRIECTFHTGAQGVSEIRFNPGFSGKLANGVKVGGPDNIVELYGKPEYTIERPNGAKEYEYSSKGILFWTYRGQVSQIVVFKPYVQQRKADKQ